MAASQSLNTSFPVATAPGFSLHPPSSFSAATTAVQCFPAKPTYLKFPAPGLSQQCSIIPTRNSRKNSTTATKVSFFPAFLTKSKDAKVIKEEVLEAMEPLDRGADANPEDQKTIVQIARKLEAANPTKQPLKSDLLNGKWELIYTTSRSILQIEVTADLTPLNSRKVAVKFDYFKIGGLIPVKAPDTARGELDITYLDEDFRVSRGDKGNLFILKMIDPSYRVPVK